MPASFCVHVLIENANVLMHCCYARVLGVMFHILLYSFRVPVEVYAIRLSAHLPDFKDFVMRPLYIYAFLLVN